MLKDIFGKRSKEIKMVKNGTEGVQLNTFVMAYNQGGIFPMVLPVKPKNVCVEGTSCDRFR